MSDESRAERKLDQLRRGGRLPTFSLAGMTLLRMRRSNEPTVTSVILALQADRRLAEFLLRLGQSLSRDEHEAPDTIEKLVEAFGPDSVRYAALAISLASCNRVGICTGFNYDNYWSKCLAKATAASELAAELGGMKAMDAFAVALLSDAGRLTFASAYPDEYTELLDKVVGEPRQSLMDLERAAFGANQHEMSVAFLEYLGFEEETYQCLIALSEDALSETKLYLDGVNSSSLLTASERISETFMADAASRTGQWFELVNLRYRLHLEREAFNQIGDRISQRWWEWGEVLRVPTHHVPSFAELAHQAVQTGSSEEDELEPDLAAEPLETSDKLKVLVVDDDPVALRLLKRNLIGDGHLVTTAADGKQALFSALEDTPHMIVADWVMPHMDGIQLCQALRRFDAGRRIFFLLVTGKEEEARMIEAFEAGVDDFINKPVRTRPFLARVRGAKRVIGLRRELDQEKTRLRVELDRVKLLTRKLSMAALTDMLTELPNRRYAIKRISEDWANSERTGKALSVVLIDIDHFKAINDSYGHDIGDLVLRETAGVLERTTRREESACRVGGEEFLVICDGSNLEDATQCAERIRSAIEAHLIDCAGFQGRLTISAGVAEKSKATRDLDHLLKVADEAVYEAKEQGRNRVVVGRVRDEGDGKQGTDLRVAS